MPPSLAAASQAAVNAASGFSNTAISPSPSRFTIVPPPDSSGGSICLPTRRSSSTALSSPAFSAQSENSTRSVNTIAVSLLPRPRPCASDSACHIWRAPKPTSRSALGRFELACAMRWPIRLDGSFPATERGSPCSGSPGSSLRSVCVPLTSPGRESTLPSAAAKRRQRPRGCSATSGADVEESLVALHLTLSACLLLAVVLCALHGPLRLLEPRVEVGLVDVVGGDRLLHEHEHLVLDHLEVALPLGEADDVGVGAVQPQLGRLEHGHQRGVVGEHADRPRGRPGGHHLHLVGEHLPLRGEHLALERPASHPL